MYSIFLYFFLFSSFGCPFIHFHVNKKINIFDFKLLNDNNNQQYNKNNNVTILNIDLISLIETYDLLKLNNMNNQNLSVPLCEEDIQQDSFEGFLQKEFYKISYLNRNTIKFNINFDIFYHWRKNNIGTLFNYEELKDFYDTLVADNDCDIMLFILLNYIIDENDGVSY